MPDTIKIHEPKDEQYDIKPEAIAAQSRE